MKTEKKFDWEKLLKFCRDKKNLLFVVGLAGIVLIAFADFSPKKTQQKEDASQEQQTQQVEDYAAGLESRLTQMLEGVDGVGKVSVMVTLENTTEYVYAQTEKNDSDYETSAGERTVEKSSYDNDYILVKDEDGTLHALTQTTMYPAVQGVAVVCSGADDIKVVKRVTELVSTVLGITTNRVYVTK